MAGLEDLDAFEAAAQRRRHAVKPPKGRKEGLGTMFLERYPAHIMSGLMSLPDRALQAAGSLQYGGSYDPGPALETSLMTMGGTAFGAPRGAVGAGPVRRRQPESTRQPDVLEEIERLLKGLERPGREELPSAGSWAVGDSFRIPVESTPTPPPAHARKLDTFVNWARETPPALAAPAAGAGPVRQRRPVGETLPGAQTREAWENQFRPGAPGKAPQSPLVDWAKEIPMPGTTTERANWARPALAEAEARLAREPTKPSWMADPRNQASPTLPDSVLGAPLARPEIPQFPPAPMASPIGAPAVHTPRFSREFVPEIDTTGWQKTKGAGGVTPGGFFRDPQGGEWYLKSAPEGHIQSERIARDLYGLSGAAVPQTFRAVAPVELTAYKGTASPGEPALASKIIPGKVMSEMYPQYPSGVPSEVFRDLGQHQLTDAWLNNRDLHGGNVLIPSAPGGRPTRIDFGSSLAYDPFGRPREFSTRDAESALAEIKSWGDIYKGVTPAESARAALLNLPKEEVVKILNQTAETSKLVTPALERRLALLRKYLPDESFNTIAAGVMSGGAGAAALDPESRAILKALIEHQNSKEQKNAPKER